MNAIMLSRRLWIGVVIAIFTWLALLYGRIVIQSDGITYYALTRSLALQGNFALSNGLSDLPDLRVLPGRSGRMVAVYSCGYACLYAPFLWSFNQLSGLTAWKPYAQNALIPFSHSLAIFTGSLTFSLLSVFLGVRIAERNGAGLPAALFAALAVFLGTPLAFYTFVTPSFPHAADSFLTTAAFVLVFSRFKGRNAVLGFVLGLSVLLRVVNVLFVPPMLLTLLYVEYKSQNKRWIPLMAELLAGALPTIALLFYYNWTQYGGPLMTGYGIPPDLAPSFVRRIYLITVSPSLGIFAWTPIAALSLIGLIAGIAKRKPASVLALSAVVLFGAFTCVVGLIFSGASFGHRLYTHLFPFWVLGLSELLQWQKRKIIVPAAAAAVLWTFLLFNAYFIVFASPAARKEFGEDSHQATMIKMLHLAGRTCSEESPGSNPWQVWSRSLCALPYPTLQCIIRNSQEGSTD